MGKNPKKRLKFNEEVSYKLPETNPKGPPTLPKKGFWGGFRGFSTPSQEVPRDP